MFCCVVLRYIAQADNPIVAARILQEHDDLVANGKRPHRVTDFFAGPGENSLRADMEHHAAGQGMSDRLRCEICSYQFCKIDDTWAEAVHRDISGFGKRASAAKAPYIAASHRLQQTLASIDSMTVAETRKFYDFMRKYKAIGQLSPRRAKALRSVHRKVGDLLGQIYRYDRSACRDWGSELGMAISFLEDRPARRRGIAERLKLEYMDRAILDGAVFSVPSVSDALLDQANQLPLADVPNVLRQGSASATAETFFIIVDKSAGRKKQLRTAATSAAHRDMIKPVSLQRMTLWPAAMEQDGSPPVVYHDGFPHIVDLFSLAPWLILRAGLLRWRSAESAHCGCLSLAAPAAVKPICDWRRDETPALCLLEELAMTGWTRGQAPSEHTVLSSKIFAVKDPIASKSYLRCLLGLTDLLAEGKLPCLRSDQPAMYYSCVLASDQPQMVPCGQAPAVYKKMLVSPADALAPLADAEPASPASAASSDSVEVEVIRSVAKPGPKRVPGGGGCGGKRKRVTQEDWGKLVWAAPPPAVQSVAETSAVGPALGSGAASSSDPAGADTVVESARAPAESGQVMDAAAASSVVQARARAFMEGVEVYEEAHGIMGQPGSYRRLIVKCPHHSTTGNPCRKTRSFGVRSAEKSGLGDMEPYAFLGAWLQAHEQFADGTAHKRFGPSPAQVTSYAVALGWRS